MLDFPVWLRATHFLNLLFISLLIRSGIEILSAHPRLYLDDNSRPGGEWLKLTHRKPTPGKLWTSMDETLHWPSWLALPGGKNLGLGRHWHFLIDFAWITTGLIYYILLFATGEWQRIIPTSWQVIPGAWQSLLIYLSGHLPPDAGYNPLQQLSYAGVVFILSPLAIATGLAMSPDVAGHLPWYTKLFGSRQTARSIHFLVLLAFVAFTVIHTAMVIWHGLPKELGAIVLGETQNPDAALALVLAGVGIATVIVVNILATVMSLRWPRFVKNSIEIFTDAPRRLLFHHLPSEQHYPEKEIAPYFWVNGPPPVDSGYHKLARDNFRSYKLEVKGLVVKPLHLSLDEIHALPRQTQITKHVCIQGWTDVAEWGGVQLAQLIELCQPVKGVRYVVFHAFDEKSEGNQNGDGKGAAHYYETIDLELAKHPQTILAYEMNGAPLTHEHGAPLRLRVETQLGFKMVKYIRAIEFVADYRGIGQGQGGWREDFENYSVEAGI